MDETCRLRRGEGYGVCADAVVSKCALREERQPLRTACELTLQLGFQRF